MDIENPSRSICILFIGEENKKRLPNSMFSLVLCKVNGYAPLDFTYVVIMHFDQSVIVVALMNVWTFFRQ